MEQRNILSPGQFDAGYLTPDFIIGRLQADARARSERGDHDLNPGVDFDARRRRAAVLVPLIDRDEGLTVLLTLRTHDLPQHGGQVSFPGGRIDPEDASAEAAALREAEEEVGLDRSRVRLIDRLDSYVTGTGFHITPVVGIVSPPFTLTLAPAEVADAFEVPLAVAVDPRNHERQPITVGERNLQTYLIPWEGRLIWGATAGMLVNLGRILAAPDGGR